jgi:hypothetical protein
VSPAVTGPSHKQHYLLPRILVCLPALALGILLLRYSVDVPFWDQWEPIAIVTAARHGTLTFQDLWRQQNDSRQFFPRLIDLAVELVARGDVRYEILATFLLAVLVMWNVYRLGLRTLPPGAARSLATVLASVLIFSPIQWGVWLWGIQLIFLMPIACLTAAIVVCYSDYSAWAKLWISSALAAIATYSYAHGMICWVALLCLVLMQFEGIGARLKAAAVWMALAVGGLIAYFHGYRSVGDTGKLTDSLELPYKAIRCFLAFLGGSLGSARGLADLKLALAIGFLAICVTILVGFKLLCSLKEPGVLWRSAGWLTIAAYSLGTGVILTLGRVRMAPKFLLDSRYTTCSLYLLVALIFLLAILYKRPGAQRRSKKRIWGVVAPVTAFILLHLLNSWHAVAQMKELRTERLRAKGCLAFLNVVDSPCQASELFWMLPELKITANALDRLGYLHPALIKSPDLRQIGRDAFSKQYGSLESFVNVGDGFYRASGWAFLPKRSEPADVVLLSYVLPDGQAEVFAIADSITRSDLADRYGTGYARSGWEQWMKIPAGADTIQAWAYDAIEGRAFPLLNAARASVAPVAGIRFKSDDGGAFDGIAVGDPAVAGGWAVLWQKHRPADRVLLTCGPSTLIASGVPTIERPDVVVTFNDNRLSGAGWSIPIPVANIPRQGCEVKAWAWDRLTTEAMLLTPTHILSPPVR